MCVSRVQQQLEVARALEAEVEAARRQVEEGKDEREQLLSRLSHLERDNTSLTTRLHTLSKQVCSEGRCAFIASLYLFKLTVLISSSPFPRNVHHCSVSAPLHSFSRTHHIPSHSSFSFLFLPYS